MIGGDSAGSRLAGSLGRLVEYENENENAQVL